MKLGKKKKDSRPPDWLFFAHPADRKRFFTEDWPYGIKYQKLLETQIAKKKDG